MTRGASVFVLAVALGACACGGSTSSTQGAGGSSIGGSNPGGGGAGTGAVAGSGGSIETGGAGGSGNGLTQVLPLVQAADGSSPFPGRYPHLVTSNDVGQQVSVAFSRAAPDSVQLHHATFFPWTDWPASGVVKPVYDSFSGPDLSPDFRVGASNDSHFALLVWHDIPGGSFLRFAPEVDAVASGPAPDATFAGTAPLFVARGWAAMGGFEGPIWHLVGTSQAGTLLAYLVQDGPGPVGAGAPIPLGCANGAIVADGVLYQQGWLVALSNAQEAPDIGCGSAAPGPPTRIDFVYLASFGPPSYLASFDAGAPLDSLVVASHPRGLHVAFHVASGGAVAPIRWLRFDAPTQQVIGPGDVTGPADAPQPAFAATALGSDVAVVWGNDPADNPPDLVVSVLGENGDPKASATLADHPHSSVSVLGAPNGQSLVVAWDETDPATQDSTAMLARFDRTP